MVQNQNISHLPLGTRCGHYVLQAFDDPGEKVMELLEEEMKMMNNLGESVTVLTTRATSSDKDLLCR